MNMRHIHNKKLIDAGLATDTKSADKLRATIEGDIDAYIEAQGKTVHTGHATATPSGASVMGEIRALMYQDGLSFQAAESLRGSILKAGGTVSSYIEADAQPVKFGGADKAGPMAVFKAAQTLIRLAEGSEGAIRAINLFAQLESPIEETAPKGRAK